MTVLLNTSEPGSFAYHGVVEYGRPHAYKCVVFYSGSMYGDVVSDGYVVAYLDGRFFVECVQHTAILYVYTVADAYGVDVAS